MTVREYLQSQNPEQYHIFDSHQEAMDERGVTHGDQDFLVYSYNIHKNNKPKAGDLFLYRRPGKSSKTRKFYIYGGGVIDQIVEKDAQGNVEAYITKPFKLVEPLVQSESDRLEKFEWTSKEKEPGSWSHFWNQYGMNVIDAHDFWGLVGDLAFTLPLEYNVLPPYPDEQVEEIYNKVDTLDSTGFTVSVYDDDHASKMPIQTGESTLTGRHINFDAVEHMKQNLGKAGEMLVMEYLSEQLDLSKYQIEHTSIFKGDGYGYDIKVTRNDGQTTYIEVKTTKTKFVDGFYISPRELNASRRFENYQIYRVYNFDPETKTACIKVFDAPFTDEEFRFVPVGWKVHMR